MNKKHREPQNQYFVPFEVNNFTSVECEDNILILKYIIMWGIRNVCGYLALNKKKTLQRSIIFEVSK